MYSKVLMLSVPYACFEERERVSCLPAYFTRRHWIKEESQRVKYLESSE